MSLAPPEHVYETHRLQEKNRQLEEENTSLRAELAALRSVQNEDDPVVDTHPKVRLTLYKLAYCMAVHKYGFDPCAERQETRTKIGEAFIYSNVELPHGDTIIDNLKEDSRIIAEKGHFER